MNAHHGVDPVREGLGKAPAALHRRGCARLPRQPRCPAHRPACCVLDRGAPADIDVAQVYFRPPPITDVRELRAVARGIGGCAGPMRRCGHRHAGAAQPVDGELRKRWRSSIPAPRNASVQRAIAGNFIRADYTAIGKTDVLRVVRDYRLKSSNSDSLDPPPAVAVIRPVCCCRARRATTATPDAEPRRWRARAVMSLAFQACCDPNYARVRDGAGDPGQRGGSSPLRFPQRGLAVRQTAAT